jgi:hypothetical protein
VLSVATFAHDKLENNAVFVAQKANVFVLWLFLLKAKPRINSFAVDGSKARSYAFNSSVLDSVARQAQFNGHRSGVYQPAIN